MEIVSVISGALPIAAAVLNFRNLNVLLKIIAALFLFSFIVDAGLWMALLDGLKNDMYVIHVYIVVSLIFYTIIYHKLFEKKLLKNITIIFSCVAAIIMLIYNHNLNEYPSVSNTALGVFLITLSLCYFYQLLNPQEFVHIEKQGPFWINAGILFYSAVNIFLFMLLNQIPQNDRAGFYMIHSISNIIANILYSIGLLCKPQKTS
ncbi:hypothetical protein HYN43_022930 [Mucilaginibacter celer]|uniref:Uncharacterized protein n=1 Tax=Mucilaginibacter celer TaxID=2305508 RepID=A0A494W349_9SPHI|nr:hypothetical protein HYN43_022930 [Mucilaginibacter celer]